MTQRPLSSTLADPAPLPHHGEPIWLDGSIVGQVISAVHSHMVGSAVVREYVAFRPGQAAPGVEGRACEIEIADERWAARLSLAAPRGSRARL